MSADGGKKKGRKKKTLRFFRPPHRFLRSEIRLAESAAAAKTVEDSVRMVYEDKANEEKKQNKRSRFVCVTYLWVCRVSNRENQKDTWVDGT